MADTLPLLRMTAPSGLQRLGAAAAAPEWRVRRWTLVLVFVAASVWLAFAFLIAPSLIHSAYASPDGSLGARILGGRARPPA